MLGFPFDVQAAEHTFEASLGGVSIRAPAGLHVARTGDRKTQQMIGQPRVGANKEVCCLWAFTGTQGESAAPRRRRSLAPRERSLA